MNILNNDYIYLYNDTHKLWIGIGLLRHDIDSQTHNDLQYVPILTSSVKYALKFQIQNIGLNLGDKSLTIKNQVILRGIESNNDKLFLGTTEEVPTNKHGNRVYMYDKVNNKSQIKWTIWSDHDNDFVIQYGVVYNLYNSATNSFLCKRYYDIWKDENVLVSSSSYINGHKDCWKFIPDKNVNVCTKYSESGCVISGGLSNNYLDLRCTRIDCYDKFNNKVYLEYDVCKKKCKVKTKELSNIKLTFIKNNQKKNGRRLIDILNKFFIILLIMCIIQRFSKF
jgi:hypothetical protein